MTSKLFSLRNLLPLLATSMAGAQSLDIVRVNFDEFPGSVYFGFAYAGYGPTGGGNVVVNESITQVTEVSFGEGIDGGSAFKLTGDTSATDEAFVTPNSYTYAGYGLALESNLQNFLPTGDLSQYVLDVSLKAEGMVDGINQSSGLVDIRFFAPDGTLQPDDADADADIIFTARYNNSVFAGTDFRDNQFRLDSTYEVRQGSLENFQTHFAAIDYISIIVEMNNATDDFGFDTGNVILLDNLSLTNSSPPPPPAENPIVQVNFDENPRSWGGSYYAFAGPDANNVGDLPRTDDVLPDADAGPSQIQRNCLDTTSWAGADPFNGGGWLGFAGTVASEIAPGIFPSSDPSEYRVNFDAKATGFLADPGGKMLVSLLAPDDTLSPPDADDARDILIRFRIADDDGFGNGFTLSETYSSFGYNLGDVEVDAETEELKQIQLDQMQSHLDQITVVEFALEGITTAANTGFDADNCIYLDNIQLLHLTPPGPDILAPRILEVSALAPDQFSISFESIPGHRYAILGSADLSTGFVEFDQIEATGNVTTFSSNETLADREFFQIEDLGVDP